MENALWFAAGFILARLASYLKAFVQSYLMIKQAEFDCLRMLGSTSESTAFLNESKKKMIFDSDLPNDVKNQLKIQVNLDEHLFSIWKASTISNFIANYPARYRKSLEYHDWEGAMSQLSLLHKNGKK